MSYVGKLLIAPPKVNGTFWTKSTVFVSEDSYLGSVGVVLNKPSKVSLKDFGTQCNVDLDYDGKVYVGGSSNPKALTMLHSSEWRCNNTLKVNKNFSLSSSEELLYRLESGDAPYFWKLIVGLSSWPIGQLDNEVKGVHPYNQDNSWLVATPSYNLVFGLDTTDQWVAAIEQSSIEFAQTVLA
jgi:putative transcriptional regulator